MNPIKFKPQYKSVIWGGSEIAVFKGIALDRQDIGESWEISGLPGKESIVAEGPFKGMPMHELLRINGREIMGERLFRLHGTVFPLLLKIIDAHMDLSLQVHPDDEMARKNGYCNGKTEMWHLIESRPGAKIYAGFKNDISHEELKGMIERKSLLDAVVSFDSCSGDTFFVPAGRIHAIGAGNLLIEIQQTADISYRLYDYDRRDSSGRPRDLHIEEAAEALDYRGIPDSRIAPKQGATDREKILARCDHFTARSLVVEGPTKLFNPDDSFMIATCIEGETLILNEHDEPTRLLRGETALIPASRGTVTLTGKGTILAFTA